MATHTNLSGLFTAIADAIRVKNGSTGAIVADNFPTEILNLQTGTTVDWTPVNTRASEVLEGNVFYNCLGELTTGTYIEGDYDFGLIYTSDPYSLQIEGLDREPKAFMIISYMDSMGWEVGGDYNVILGMFGYNSSITRVSGAGMWESTSLQSAYVLWANNGDSDYHTVGYSWDASSGTVTLSVSGGETDSNICVPLYFGVEDNDESGAYQYMVYFEPDAP